MVTTNEPNVYETGVLDSNAEGNFVYTTLDAANVSSLGGNMILKVKDSRVALGRDMASKIQVA